MNLNRLGHLYQGADGGNVEDGICEAALVIAVDHDGQADTVNLVAWSATGDQRPHSFVPVSDPRPEQRQSFHLSADCPWER